MYWRSFQRERVISELPCLMTLYPIFGIMWPLIVLKPEVWPACIQLIQRGDYMLDDPVPTNISKLMSQIWSLVCTLRLCWYRYCIGVGIVLVRWQGHCVREGISVSVVHWNIPNKAHQNLWLNVLHPYPFRHFQVQRASHFADSAIQCPMENENVEIQFPGFQNHIGPLGLIISPQNSALYCGMLWKVYRGESH